jgi:hypothetical protein
MTNDEIPNDELIVDLANVQPKSLRTSPFGVHSSLGISSFELNPPTPPPELIYVDAGCS